MTPVRLHEFFEAWAELRPRDAAVVLGDRSVTYGDLNARANQLARELRERGAARGTVVATLLPRSIEAYTAILAVLKAGAAYVPIDPAYPEERIAWILADSEACAVVTEKSLGERYQAFGGPVIYADADAERNAAENPAALASDERSARPEDLCYLIYTSGSTGRPKGVMVEHRNACHLVEAERRVFEVGHEDRVYQGASFCFDLSVEEMWLAFGAGATLVAATPEMSSAGPDLARHLANRGVTVLSCVPTLLSMMDQAELPALRRRFWAGRSVRTSSSSAGRARDAAS